MEIGSRLVNGNCYRRSCERSRERRPDVWDTQSDRLCSKQAHTDRHRHQHGGLREGYQRQDRL
jgi:hypothetical protein